ncbi:uncharacterized protein [Palaemon carinicauda]|uniref:uncharacterized protein n=1 Tax=Palaemon carinicauda TaxID=392227 RepID=UPI0035B699FF
MYGVIMNVGDVEYDSVKVPENMCEFINLKRKEKMRLMQERMTWDDILEIVEDYELDRCMKESKSVSVRTGKEESVIKFSSYEDAILRGPMRVADQVIHRSVRASNGGTMQANFGFRQGNWHNRDKSVSAQRGMSDSRVRACFGCGDVGHRIGECKKENGVKCCRCGMTGHIVSGCPSHHINVICGNCGGASEVR